MKASKTALPLPDLSCLKDDPFVQTVGAAFEHLGGGNGTALLGISGGPDSVALLWAILAWTHHNGSAAAFRIAHINHTLRAADSDADEAFVRQLAVQCGIAIEVCRSDTAAVSASEHLSIETARATGTLYVFCALCLHASLSYGAVGPIMPRIRPRPFYSASFAVRVWPDLPACLRDEKLTEGIDLIRPMLNVRRSDVLAFLDRHHLPYRHDHSNIDTRFTRNRIRHDLLPELEDHYNAQVRNALLNLSQTAQWANELIDARVESVFASLATKQKSQDDGLNTFHVPQEFITPLHMIERAGLIRRILEHLAAPMGAVGMEHVKTVLALIETGGVTELPGPVRVTCGAHAMTFGVLKDHKNGQNPCSVA